MWSARRSVPITRPSFSNMIRKAKQSFCETFRSFDGLASLGFGVVIVQIASGKRDTYLKRTIVNIDNPVRFAIAYDLRCVRSYHFDLRHRHRSYFRGTPVLKRG